jgi:ABC-type Fe3+-hydroxamate transport system substrate-binding protein
MVSDTLRAPRLDRRRLLTLLGGAAFAAGCGGAAGATTSRRPERVACIAGAEELHAALLLGVDPVIAARGTGDAILARLGFRLDRAARPATGSADPATVAAAGPDLVPHTGTADPARLRMIAPVVAVDPTRPVEDQLRALGAVLEREAEALQAIGGHRYRTERVVEGGSALAGVAVAVVDVSPAGLPRLLSGATPAGEALRAVGGRWVGAEFLLESALARLARLIEIERVARLLTVP